MSDFPLKINNSYESGSSSSESASSLNDQVLDKSIQFDDMENNKLTSLMLPATGTDSYNTSAEEGIFPNVSNYQIIEVPSYQPDYDYMNEYSDTPLVYSWLPIVPGFTQDGFNNLHNFQHLAGKYLHTKSLNTSDSSVESEPIPNQNLKFHDFLVINNINSKMLNNDVGMKFHNLENSCNAMDVNISCTEQSSADLNLSFNGKITELKAHEKSLEEENAKKVEKEAEEERLHNESFELLKKEDSSKMLYINEKSPDLFDCNGEVMSDEQQDEAEVHHPEVAKSFEDCDNSVLNKLRNSLAGLCPPPSVTRFQPSLSEMLTSYNKNLNDSTLPQSTVKSSSFFVPSHGPEEVKTLEWPSLLATKCLDVSYNKSTATEDIEVLCLRYVERYIGAETHSSFNHKIGPSSAKKRIEKLKLLTQSPGRRLSHLANRRKVFSSANLLKSSSSSASQTLSTSGRQILIDKSKLYSKTSRAKSPKKRTSAKKKTPGKRKTPKSAKREMIMNPEPSRVSSKRALFTSPLQSGKSLTIAPKDVSMRGRLPRRTLFSPMNEENKKRKRSPLPDQDAENQGRKLRRFESPTKMPKSQSFSVAPSSSCSSMESRLKMRMLYRTQSEVFAHSSETSGTSLGFKDAMTDVIKKKILWSVSTALTSKQITNEHEKFKEFASILAKLVKRIFIEFYNPADKSVGGQLMKFATHMVFYVIQGRASDEIYTLTRTLLQSKNTTKVSGYIAQQDYERNKQFLIRKNSSLLFMSQSCTSLNQSQQSENSYDGNSLNSSKLSESSSSINRSSSKNNELLVLRENLIATNGDKSARKFGGSESNLLRTKSNSSSNLMKAKRQISF